MKRTTIPAAAQLPLLWTELVWASWETIARRSLMMMSGTCSSAEYHRMGAEKLKAVTKATQVLTSKKVPASGRGGARTIAAALRPFHAPAVANAKRLRRKK
jgi:hypothetical protein